MSGLAYMHAPSARDQPNKAAVYHGDLKGVSYLSHAVYMHRFTISLIYKDNVLVEVLIGRRQIKYPIGKITDFGLASIQTKGKNGLPTAPTEALRWVSPELAKFYVHTVSEEEEETYRNLLEKADVWSFALTTLEVSVYYYYH